MKVVYIITRLWFIENDDLLVLCTCINRFSECNECFPYNFRTLCWALLHGRARILGHISLQFLSCHFVVSSHPVLSCSHSFPVSFLYITTFSRTCYSSSPRLALVWYTCLSYMYSTCYSSVLSHLFGYL